MSKSALVQLGESSPFKVDLNLGIASLFEAPESYFRPHVCLNGKEGLSVLQEIAKDPKKANTEIRIAMHYPSLSGDELWLNIHFVVFLNRFRWPDCVASLSPRQTSFIVTHLPKEAQAQILEKVKIYYLEWVIPNIQAGLASITEQFNEGNPLLADDHQNRIFDIHGGRSMEVPYVELGIVGEHLAEVFLYGVSLRDCEEDGYERCDQVLGSAYEMRKRVADDLLTY